MSENLLASPDDDHPDNGLAVKVDKTTLEQFRLLGVDRPWTVIEVATVLLIAIGLKNWYVLGAPLVTHPLLWISVRKDPDLIKCYLRYRKQGDYYEPRQFQYQRINCRPKGFGRGALV